LGLSTAAELSDDDWKSFWGLEEGEKKSLSLFLLVTDLRWQGARSFGTHLDEEYFGRPVIRFFI
jgi:hypothetical protein